MECKNCHARLQETDNYCNNCGAKVIRKPITFRNFIADFSAQFLNYDNKFLQTFIVLFSNPKEVIGGYLQGTRKKYVNVISYFAIAITLSGLQIYIVNKYFPEILDLSAITAAGSEEFSKKNMEFVNEYQSLVMMLYVPIYAFLAKLVFWRNKKFNYAELVVIFTYILSQISIIGSVLTLAGAIIGIDMGSLILVLFPLQLLYSAYCLRYLYELGINGIVLRTLLFLLILAVFLFIVMIIVGFIMYFSGAFREVIDAQKGAQKTAYMLSSAMNWTS